MKSTWTKTAKTIVQDAMRLVTGAPAARARRRDPWFDDEVARRAEVNGRRRGRAWIERRPADWLNRHTG